MSVYTFSEALQLLSEGNHIALLKTLNVWHLEMVEPKKGNPIATMPIIVRVNNDGTRAPWPPNTADIVSGQYVMEDESEPTVTIQEHTCAWAFQQLLEYKARVRRRDWKDGQHIVRFADKIYMVLPNGKELDAEFHPDFFDMAGEWEALA